MTRSISASAFFSLAYLIIGNLALFAQDSAAVAVGEEEKIYVVEEMPDCFCDFGHGALYKFLYKTLRYPKEAREQNIQGTVFVSFVVEKDGKVTKIEIVKGVKMLNDEAKRVVGLTQWIPRRQDGKIVRARFVIPIAFKLVDEEE